MEVRPSSNSQVPLYCDLDGTLFRGDLLIESFISAFRADPWVLFRIPGWWQGGRAVLKMELAKRCNLDVSTLPYRTPVLEWIQQQRRSGRRILLATAAAKPLANQVAQHLGLFDGVIATEGSVNLKSRAKLEAIQQATQGEFDYLGDSKADLSIWDAARQAYCVGKPLRPNIRSIDSTESTLVDVLALLRPYQWCKNALVFSPILFAHHFFDVQQWISASAAFIAFSAMASSIYVVNDFLDVHADRQHPRKRRRPLANGTVPFRHVPIIILMLLIVGLSMSWALPKEFWMTLGTYVALSLAYSAILKTRLMIDVIVLATLYAIRIIAGGAATGIAVSPWLLGFSLFLFSSLAMAKRYAELRMIAANDEMKIAGRGYCVEDLPILAAAGVASGFLAVLVMAFYVNGDTVRTLYRTPNLLWLVCPVLMYWITRMWFIANRGKLHDDPILFAARDPMSWMVVLVVAIIGVFAMI